MMLKRELLRLGLCATAGLVIGLLCVVISTLIYLPFVMAAAKANIAAQGDEE